MSSYGTFYFTARHLLWSRRDRRVKKSEGLQKGDDPDRWQLYEKRRFLQKVEAILQEVGMETQLFEGIEPDPSIETVFKGAAAMRKFLPDVIVAIGGGSPIDAAKAMWVFYEHPEATFEEIKKPFNIPPLRGKAIL